MFCDITIVDAPSKKLHENSSSLVSPGSSGEATDRPIDRPSVSWSRVIAIHPLDSVPTDRCMNKFFATKSGHCPTNECLVQPQTQYAVLEIRCMGAFVKEWESAWSLNSDDSVLSCQSSCALFQHTFSKLVSAKSRFVLNNRQDQWR